jgi:hypothetical protein
MCSNTDLLTAQIHLTIMVLDESQTTGTERGDVCALLTRESGMAPCTQRISAAIWSAERDITKHKIPVTVRALVLWPDFACLSRLLTE